MERTCVGAVREGLYPVGGTPDQTVWGARSSRDEVMDWRQPAFLIPLWCLERGGSRRVGVNLSLGRRRE